VTQEEALAFAESVVARRGIRALYRLALVMTTYELNGIRAEIMRLGLDGMRAVAFLERCLKEAQSG